jgi:hypothetical protein
MRAVFAGLLIVKLIPKSVIYLLKLFVATLFFWFPVSLCRGAALLRW